MAVTSPTFSSLPSGVQAADSQVALSLQTALAGMGSTPTATTSGTSSSTAPAGFGAFQPMQQNLNSAREYAPYLNQLSEGGGGMLGGMSQGGTMGLLSGGGQSGSQNWGGSQWGNMGWNAGSQQGWNNNFLGGSGGGSFNSGI